MITTSDPALRAGWISWDAEGTNGYGHVSMSYREAMVKAGLHVTSPYQRNWDVLLAFMTPVAWLFSDLQLLRARQQPRHELVFHTMFEAEPMPPGWVDNLNAAGLVWVPSQYCVDLFKASGVQTEIIKVGYGVNHDVYKPINRSGRDGPMRFIVWADSLVSRKNVLTAARAFIAADLPDARLDIKLFSFTGEDGATFFQNPDGKPYENIKIHTGGWSRKEVVDWLHASDCLIYLSGGEGYGLMPLECMATGLPVIVARNTGMEEYLNDDVALCVPCYERTQSVSYTLGFGYPATIWKPDFEAVVEQIRRAYWERETAYEMGNRAAIYSQQFRWDTVGAQALAELAARYGK